MAISHKSDETPPNLVRLIERGRRESQEARRQIGGDPDEAFDEFIRSTYDLKSLEGILREMIEEGPGWLDDDADEPAVD